MIVSMNAKKERPTEAKENQTKPNQREKKLNRKNTRTQYVYVFFLYNGPFAANASSCNEMSDTGWFCNLTILKSLFSTFKR